MKVGDSGMPEETYWNSLFDIDAIVGWLAVPEGSSVVEIGCGYGIFTVQIAKKPGCTLHAFDIEPTMIETARENVRKSGASNVTFQLRDVVEQGTGIDAESVEMVLLFNILHFSQKRTLLAEAARILKKHGIVAIIHWRKDIPTPRGPAIDDRPDMDQIMDASAGLGLVLHGDAKVLEPYHWGIQLTK